MDLSNTEQYIAKEVLGWISVVLLSVLYIPQVIIVYRKRDPSGLSWLFLGIGLVLTSDVVAYGILLREWPLIISNSVVFVCMVLISIAKCLWGNKGKNTEINVVDANDIEVVIEDVVN